MCYVVMGYDPETGRAIDKIAPTHYPARDMRKLLSQIKCKSCGRVKGFPCINNTSKQTKCLDLAGVSSCSGDTNLEIDLVNVPLETID